MKIEFYKTSSGREPVRDYIYRLQKEEIGIIIETFKKIETYGFKAFGVQFRQIRGKLWEIKISEHRIFYVLFEKDLMILLHAYKKQSQKLPFKDRMLAIERMKKVLW